jgi:hypothetical protein
MTDHDPYWKLRPPPPTPADELCACVDAPPILLRNEWSTNPLRCIVCKLEVAPEKLGFDERLADKVAFWQRFYECFDYLWIESREFESWAKAQLEDPTGPVNRRGLDLASKLNAFRRTYYSWFQDTSPEVPSATPTHCPVCRAPLVALFDRRVCDACSIALDA